MTSANVVSKSPNCPKGWNLERIAPVLLRSLGELTRFIISMVVVSSSNTDVSHFVSENTEDRKQKVGRGSCVSCSVCLLPHSGARFPHQWEGST